MTRSAAVTEAKQLLRGTVRARVRALPPQELARQSEDVVAQLLSHEWFGVSCCVCCYIPMAGKELDTYGLLRAVLGSGRQLVVPRVFGSGPGEMSMLPVASVEELESLLKNKWGIPEHPIEALEGARGISALAAQIDLLVVPAVAYDLAGHRLGQGRGYYDSFLQRLGAAQAGGDVQVRTVGLGLDCQIVEAGQVPVDELDETLDLVLCSGGGRCTPGGPPVTPTPADTDAEAEPGHKPDSAAVAGGSGGGSGGTG